MERISVPRNPPRNVSAFRGKIDFRQGLRGWYFSCWLMMLFGGMLLAAAALPPFEPGLIMFKLSAACMSFGAGVLLLVRTGRIVRSRVSAFEKGAIVSAEVLSHERVFVPWKSSRDYAAVLVIPSRNGAVRRTIRSSRDLTLDLPLNSSVSVFFNEMTDDLFVPAEAGVEIIPF